MMIVLSEEQGASLRLMAADLGVEPETLLQWLLSDRLSEQDLHLSPLSA